MKKIILLSRKFYKSKQMNAQLRKQMYPVISHNNKERCEQRWEDCANAYGDISAEWQISLGNGKRLNRKWRACGGLTYVYDNNGCEKAIYNENYDREWQKAKYDRSCQPDDDPEFYSNQITRQYGNY